MSLFIETIRIVNRKGCNITLHQDRMDRTRRHFFPDAVAIDLAAGIDSATIPGRGIFKCKVIYDTEIRDVTVVKYRPRHIASMQIVTDDSIMYEFKYHDRDRIGELFAQRRDTDEILIVKNGLITDTSISNVVLFDGMQWVTPARPLLKGTRRGLLLETGKVIERDILVAELNLYKMIMPVNAMLDFDLRRAIPVSDIRGPVEKS